MAVARTWSVGLTGVDGRLVEVEADVSNGMPGFFLVGLADTAVTEARDRVRAALVNSGESWPNRRLTVSLSPADMHKRGSAFDLALAAVVLGATGSLRTNSLPELVLLGELGLDGRVRPVRGVLPAVATAAQAGLTQVVVSEADVAEAALVPGVAVLGVRSLRQLLAVLRDTEPPDEDLPPLRRTVRAAPLLREPPDLADVRGQMEARRAVEICAAGEHNLLLLGVPGAGKTMLAERLPGLLPALDRDAALEVTAIQSVAGVLPPNGQLVTKPPFCSPHHSATVAAIVGGGSRDVRPGAVSLAHRGVLFLDEAPEFASNVLNALREPMESGEVVIARSGLTARLPSQFVLALAANPCPCGFDGLASEMCECPSVVRRRYLGRLSGPLRDRMDVQVLVDRPSRVEMFDGTTPESTAVVAERVRLARDRAAHRFAGLPWSVNGQLPGRDLRRRFRAAPGASIQVEEAFARGTLTARGVDRVLRLAWTLADLAGRDRPGVLEMGEALAYRTGLRGGLAA